LVGSISIAVEDLLSSAQLSLGNEDEIVVVVEVAIPQSVVVNFLQPTAAFNDFNVFRSQILRRKYLPSYLFIPLTFNCILLGFFFIIILIEVCNFQLLLFDHWRVICHNLLLSKRGVAQYVS
jgi:hypothetical protein